MTRSKMGIVLAELRGDATVGDGPLEVMTRERDFNVIDMAGPDGQPASMPANSLIAFTAQSFRELTVDGAGADVWEFRVQMPTPTGAPATARMFVAGADILLVRALSKVMS